jgi:hypothetical protein
VYLSPERIQINATFDSRPEGDNQNIAQLFDDWDYVTYEQSFASFSCLFGYEVCS